MKMTMAQKRQMPMKTVMNKIENLKNKKEEKGESKAMQKKEKKIGEYKK